MRGARRTSGGSIVRNWSAKNGAWSQDDGSRTTTERRLDAAIADGAWTDGDGLGSTHAADYRRPSAPIRGHAADYSVARPANTRRALLRPVQSEASLRFWTTRR